MTSDSIFQFPKPPSCSWKLEIGKSVVLDSLFKSKNFVRFKDGFLADLLCGRVDKSVIAQIILLPRIDRIEGSSPVHPTSLLRFSKMFLRISLNAIYNCSRLDLQSDYSFISKN